MVNSKSTVLFNRFRSKIIPEFDLYVELKKISEDFDKTLLGKLKKDLEIYLEMEKNKMIEGISENRISSKIKDLQSSGNIVPKIGQISGSTNKNLNKGKKKTYYENDIEGVMFPNEFSTLYQLQDIIDERLNSYQLKNPIEIFDKKNIKSESEIFTSYKSFEMFMYLLNEIIELDKPISDQKSKKHSRQISFIYRRMYKDSHIKPNIKDTLFRNWLNENFRISIEQTKTLNECKSIERMLYYKTSLMLFKLI